MSRFFSLLFLAASLPAIAAPPRQISGIYPHLASFNNERECGTGAVVPIADRLWVITYGPHLPFGSSDKLYEITPELELIVRPESVGGTPANRMIHKESHQLFIGPYAIDAERKVRVIQPKYMPGRHTGNARHLTDPASKIYYATMEEGLYEVDVHTLEVTGLIADGNGVKPGQTDEARPAKVKSKLPGYHGKGVYSGQGKLIYANNGEQDKRVATDPTIPSGALAEWTTPGEDWQLIRRNQFTEVTGPGGIYGNPNPDKDPIWSIGWDYRSLILMCLHDGKWHSYRLPKGSHSYDGSHGWNTEWPRIREIGEGDQFLMTMHGTFWRFPATFTPQNSAGIAPRSNYLKVIGDFARWKDHVVFGCDDTAASEFLNAKRKAKGHTVPAGQSQSNLWFVKPDQLDHLGPVIGRGAVWQGDNIEASIPSDPYLFSGYQHRTLHLTHSTGSPVTFKLEIDQKGDGQWTPLREIPLDANGYQYLEFTPEETGAWIRLTPKTPAKNVTALFQYHNSDPRPVESSPIFNGIAKPGQSNITGGLLHARGGNFRTLRLLQQNADGKATLHDVDASLTITQVEDPAANSWQNKNVAIPEDAITIDEASVLYIDDHQRRWRLPKNDAAFDQPGALGIERLCREVCTERDLLNVHGTFYELPAENAGGFSKMRPIATHNLRIKDYATYRGLLFFSGIASDAPSDNPHLLRSADGKTALWAGVVDDLWKAGKPRGKGGPWFNTQVKAGEPSDPYLMTAYDKKSLTLSHTSGQAVTIDVQVDLTGSGDWVTYQSFQVPSGEKITHQFPDAFTAYWVRTISQSDTTATAQLDYQ
jgi:hypothetical protein